MRVGSLFAGIGGFDLGLERAGMRTVFQVEIDRRCGELLNAHWPEVPLHIDIKEVIVKPWRLTEEQKRSAVVMYEAGLSCAQVGDYFGVSRQSAWDVLRRRTTMRPRERHGSDNHFWRGTSDDDRAQNIVEKALAAGRLARPAGCSACGVIPSPMRDGRSAIQAHHSDYNRPLDVAWLCQPCHHDWHRRNKAVPRQGGDANGSLDRADLLCGGFP